MCAFSQGWAYRYDIASPFTTLYLVPAGRTSVPSYPFHRCTYLAEVMPEMSGLGSHLGGGWDANE